MQLSTIISEQLIKPGSLIKLMLQFLRTQ